MSKGNKNSKRRGRAEGAKHGYQRPGTQYARPQSPSQARRSGARPGARPAPKNPNSHVETRHGVKAVGTFCANAKGFGFVTVEDEPDDIFIPADNTGGAMHSDTVEVEIFPETGSGKRKEGVVRSIITRGLTRIIGTYDESEKGTFGFVVPDDKKIAQDLFIPGGCSMDASSGDKVVAEFTDYGRPGKKPEGKIIEVLGKSDAPGVDILSIIRAYDLPEEFPDKVTKLADHVAKPLTDADTRDRMDLRGWQMVTIDGEDSKDLDDAVSLSVEGENYKLGVHIADVSNYVIENSALDKEAIRRGTSVYLADRVIPMLPKTLSNGMCSLNQGQDRLAMSCIMTIDKKGEIIGHKIAESVICVDRRMSYNGVKKILVDKDPELLEEYKELVPMFERMQELSLILRERRHERGATDFDFPEAEIVLDERGKAIDIRCHERNVATELIEDFMLAANETVATEFYNMKVPFVYRTHGKPDEEKIQALALTAAGFGHTLLSHGGEVRPKDLQKLLEEIKGTEEEGILSRLVLRSMQQARYTVENTGHFGLAAPCYCHFTSPIRRYPDLQIHRIIKEKLHGQMDEKRTEHYEDILTEVCDHSSEMERRADEAERETVKLKKAEYMMDHIGEEFEGVISGVMEWGIFVELPNTVEGLIRVAAMEDDFYEYNEETFELVGQASHRSFKLGQTVKIRVEAADKELKTVDFALAEQKIEKK
ncbi:MAG: ribonuclease R [Clostridiales bacterium]|nr:ribonuclease R [Clostridiales bacterium]